jgi:hypothetical protein
LTGPTASSSRFEPIERKGSPLDVPGVDTELTLEEIVAVVREGRERVRAWLEEMMRRDEPDERAPDQ